MVMKQEQLSVLATRQIRNKPENESGLRAPFVEKPASFLYDGCNVSSWAVSSVG
jgi:hypothetical protein